MSAPLRNLLHFICAGVAVMLAVAALSLMAQAPRTSAGQQVHANLNQLMRGALYPAANVVFSA